MRKEDYEFEELITVKEASRLLGLSEKTVHNGNGGTEKLSRIKFGRASRLIKSEVLAYKFKQIEAAKEIRKEVYGEL